MYGFKKDCVAMRYNLFFLNQDLLINGGSRIVLNDEDAIIAHLFYIGNCIFKYLSTNAYLENCS